MANDLDQLKRRAHGDLTKRARGGIGIYLLAWLVITVPNQLYATSNEFFVINTSFLVLILLSRLVHLYFHMTRECKHIGVVNDWLVWSILVGALHWGLMTFWILSHETYRELQLYMLVTAAVLGIAGTTALSISNRIRLLFPVFILLPSIIALLLRGGSEDLIFATMIAIAMAYVMLTSKITSQDYWDAITSRLQAERHATQMEQLSITDQLTQLKNRSYLDARFGDEWKRGQRQSSPLSILMVDLDHFKLLNDSYGHVFGDACLQQVAQVLQLEIQRKTDIVARYGGEEFIVLLPDTDATSAMIVAERLLRAIENIALNCNGEPVAMTCSIGGATAVPDGQTERGTLLKEADDALYRAKKNGRNCYQAGNQVRLRASNSA